MVGSLNPYKTKFSDQIKKCVKGPKMFKTEIFLRKISILMSCIFTLEVHAHNLLDSTQQIIIVVGEDWKASTGILQRYERDSKDSYWQRIGGQINVNLGENGMGWGYGLHNMPPQDNEPVIDREGLKRSPVGIFAIPIAFGKDDGSSWSVKLPYQKISSTVFCSGDPQSKNYNRIIDSRYEPQEDWRLGEDMQDYVNQGVYIYGAMIAHNYFPVVAGKGCCFFIHVWRGPGKPTAGCTAMAANDAREIISWLDPNKKPVLIQFPMVIYPKIQQLWGLPSLELDQHYEL